MVIDSIKWRGHRCFKEGWNGFETVKLINVIIGRNNTGKSQLLDFAEVLTVVRPYQKGWWCQFEGVLDEQTLRMQFRQGVTSDSMPGDNWNAHGLRLVGLRARYTVDDQMRIKTVELLDKPQELAGPFARRGTGLMALGDKCSHALAGSHFRRLFADRDVIPEPASSALALQPNGGGATNIIRRVLSSSALRRELIQHELRGALAAIFGSDGPFTEIDVFQHDQPDDGSKHLQELWEVFLVETGKGRIPLRFSGSGLKTVILVLLNLLVVPEVEGHPRGRYVFALEELENNLHPSLLRRLFQFLQDYVEREKATIFLTTHSSVALDFFGTSNMAQIIHVSNNGQCATAKRVEAHFDKTSLVSELGAKPSDLLQANGIIWLEGPSDRVYLNRWIELFSGGSLKEGRDYQCAFYGGALLAQVQFTPPEKADAELVNLLRLNSNIVVVCDSDRTEKGAELKDRASRIAADVAQVPDAHIWITGAKEIENYLPDQVIQAALGLSDIRSPKQFERFFPPEKGDADSFVAEVLERRSLNKVEFAARTAPHMTAELMQDRFDLKEQVDAIIDRIRKWNG